jgi:hypothetical protein
MSIQPHDKMQATLSPERKKFVGTQYVYKYAVTDNLNLPYTQCDVLSANELDIFMPFFDKDLGAIRYDQADGCVIIDQAVNGGTGALSDWELVVQAAAFRNLANPQWVGLQDPIPSDPIILLPGENIIEADMTSVSIQITDGGETIDKWYKSNNFANYGVVMFNLPFSAMPCHWIQMPNTNFQVLPFEGDANGVTIILKPNCIGVAKYFRPLAIPNIRYAYNGGPALEYVLGANS